MSDLLPCAFCGSVAEYQRGLTGLRSWRAECTHCGAQSFPCDCRADVAREWNRRPSSAPVSAVRAALTHMDDRGRSNPEGNGRQLWQHDWDVLRGLLVGMLPKEPDLLFSESETPRSCPAQDDRAFPESYGVEPDDPAVGDLLMSIGNQVTSFRAAMFAMGPDQFFPTEMAHSHFSGHLAMNIAHLHAEITRSQSALRCALHFPAPAHTDILH